MTSLTSKERMARILKHEPVVLHCDGFVEPLLPSLIEVEHGLRNIMLMPPHLLDVSAYWEAIAAVLPQAEAMVRGTDCVGRK